MKFKMRKSTAVITALSMLTVGSSVYAAEYHYDGLNRITSVEKAGKTTAYIYDQGGNLLSVTSDSSKEAASSLRQTSSVLSGWTPYKTSGMQPYYELSIAQIQHELPVTQESESEEGQVNENVPETNKVPKSEETSASEEESAAEEEAIAEQNPVIGSDESAKEQATTDKPEANVSIESPGNSEASEDRQPTEGPSVINKEESDKANEDSSQQELPETVSNAEVQLMTLDAEQAGGANVYRDIPVKGGAVYVYHGWVKSSSMKNAALQVVVNYYDAQNRMITYDNLTNQKLDTDWAAYKGNATTPTEAITARIHLQIVLLKADGHAEAGFSAPVFEAIEQEDGK